MSVKYCDVLRTAFFGHEQAGQAGKETLTAAVVEKYVPPIVPVNGNVIDCVFIFNAKRCGPNAVAVCLSTFDFLHLNYLAQRRAALFGHDVVYKSKIRRRRDEDGTPMSP